MNELFNIEAEEIILGALLNDNNQWYRVTDLTHEDFSSTVNGDFFKWIAQEFNKGKSITLLHIPDEGRQYAKGLIVRAGGCVSIQPYCELVRDLAIKRKFKALLDKTLEGFNSQTDVFQALEDFNSSLDQNKNAFNIRSEQTVCKDIFEALKNKLPCFSTGIPVLDDSMMGGLFKKKTYCIAAERKVGKTIALGSISHNLSKAGVRHLFIAAEMGCNEIMQRNIAHDLGRNSFAFLDVKSRADADFQSAISDYAIANKNRALLVDVPSITFNRLKTLIVSSVRKYKIEGVVLDYLQIVTGMDKGESEAQFQGRVAQWLAEIAKKEDIFIIYAAQLNREGKLRGSEGIALAVDQLYLMKKISAEKIKAYNEQDKKRMERLRYMEMNASRYTVNLDIGNEDEPLLEINPHGPYLCERKV
jgi:replicative DNA helicase